VKSLKLKFQTVAEKTAKNFRGLLILPHLVYIFLIDVTVTVPILFYFWNC